MRPPRIAILVLFFSASLFLFCRSIISFRQARRAVTPLSSQTSSLRTFFSFTAPFSLFPPNAAISLADDNSTFFAARPAAFGPLLPVQGLSGQLWIGSGFADDNLQAGEGEGELGCSDVDGWEDGKSDLMTKAAEQALAADRSPGATVRAKPSRREYLGPGAILDRKAISKRRPGAQNAPVDDGTDDYLHLSKHPYNVPSTNSVSSHADIQSIQEAAEITGKIVLLSRGGCGFLEKVKWAQRRGAIALIVGDNQKGGPLIQMFARGNVDNVTIPSIFTSRTTAHILSSLIQPGSFIEDILDESGNPLLKVQKSGKARKNKKTEQTAHTAPREKAHKSNSAKTSAPRERASSSTNKLNESQRSWISRLFPWLSGKGAESDKNTPIKDSKTSIASAGSSQTAGSENPQGDGFQIGVHDWRDPDLVGPPAQGSKASFTSGNENLAAGDSPATETAGYVNRGGKTEVEGPLSGANEPHENSIIPGSDDRTSEADAYFRSSGPGKSVDSGTRGGLISKIFGDSDGEALAGSTTPIAPVAEDDEGPGDHEGLWITITPTSSASPFFDTLLVLVVSPLITLTVVYALLILRAKIRRRRWRAPKSVVERLPVRTYRTVAPSPSLSPRMPSPTSSSPTTPLLQGSSQPRPRSRTTTGVPEPAELQRVDNTPPRTTRSPPREKTAPHISSEWKKYMGRQVECVICLEEYVDSISRVMSLPCGHEFHVECITPWLTTRRRTCPICKGDVVRSLARGSPSTPRYEPYRDDSDDESVEASGSRANRPSSPDRRSDIEQGGILSPSPQRGRRANHNEGWLSMLSSSLGGGSFPRTRREESEDRNR